MELLVGQDLESLLASHGALSEHTIIDIMVPVVAGLVAVHDAGVVHGDQAGDDGYEDVDDRVLTERAMAGEQTLEVLPDEQLHHEIGDLVLDPDIEDVDDVGVLDGRGDACFTQESRTALRARLDAFRQHLQRDLAAQPFVLGSVDARHPAVPDARADDVGAEPRAFRKNPRSTGR